MATSQDYLEVRVCVRGAQVSAAEALMESQGVLAVSLTDRADVPILEPPVGATPMWPDVMVTGLFPADTDTARLRRTLSLLPGVESSEQVAVSSVRERDWLTAWQRDLEPMRFGQSIWIVPSHCEPPDPLAINLRLDPGLAFGSGTHPSTRLCLEWLDAHEIHGQKIIDFGCGSGVLAVAAALKGASSVIAIDNDPQALIATRDNALRNQVADRIFTALPGERDIEPADVVLANILSGTLIELAPELIESVRPGGWLVLAGILDHQAGSVQEAYSARFKKMEWARYGEWVGLSGRSEG